MDVKVALIIQSYFNIFCYMFCLIKCSIFVVTIICIEIINCKYLLLVNTDNIKKPLTLMILRLINIIMLIMIKSQLTLYRTNK